MHNALDVGCGSGTLLEEISTRQPRARLAGVDLSPAMLALARRRLGSRAILVVADAGRLPFRSQGFDLAVSASALHYWRDPIATLREIRRVLRPGGRIAITDWCADRWIDRLRDRFLRLVEPAHFRVHRAAELAGLLAQAGFRDVRVEPYRLDWFWGLMTGTAISAAP